MKFISDISSKPQKVSQTKKKMYKFKGLEQKIKSTKEKKRLRLQMQESNSRIKSGGGSGVWHSNRQL